MADPEADPPPPPAFHAFPSSSLPGNSTWAGAFVGCLCLELLVLQWERSLHLMLGCPHPFPDSSGGCEGTGEGRGSAVSIWTHVTLQLAEGAGGSTDESVLAWRNAEHGAGYSWLSASPAPPAADAPAQGSGQATVGLANTRMSFSRSEDISLLIAVDMPGWRLLVSLETATEPGWSVPGPAALPQQWSVGTGSTGLPCPHPLPRRVLMSQAIFWDPQVPQ